MIIKTMKIIHKSTKISGRQYLNNQYSLILNLLIILRTMLIKIRFHILLVRTSGSYSSRLLFDMPTPAIFLLYAMLTRGRWRSTPREFWVGTILQWIWTLNCYAYRVDPFTVVNEPVPNYLPSCVELSLLLCRLRSIAAHRDHFVRRLSVRPSVR